MKKILLQLRNNISKEYNFDFMTVPHKIFYVISISSLLLSFFIARAYCMAFLITTILLFSIIYILIFKKNKNIFEPFYLFSLYYLTVCISSYYVILTDFNRNLYFRSVEYYTNDPYFLFAVTMLMFLVGYIMTVIGYYFFHHKKEIENIKFEDQSKISNNAIIIVLTIFCSIGILNYIYNAYLFADGNVFLYLINFGKRTYEFAQGGTTLGYLFIETAIFIWMFKLLRENRLYSIPFVVFTIICFIIKVSQGRIFQSLAFVMTIIGIYYFYLRFENKKSYNSYFIIFGVSVLLVGIGAYFARILSGYNTANMLNGNILNTLSTLIGDIGYYAVDRGNLPNVAIVPKIIDSWNADIGFLFGTSFFTWVIAFLPSFLKVEIMWPSMMIKSTWFSHIEGGYLPPTGIGEMYANFGYLGPVFGMLAFGMLMSYIYDKVIRSRNFWIIVVGLKVFVGFFMLYPKGEFSNLSLWMFVPLLMSYILLKFITFLECKIKLYKAHK